MGLKITAYKDGPYVVQGDLSELEVTDAEGAPFDLGGKKMIALCRCGASVTKPFCDGQHSKIGFQAAEQAVRGD